MEKGRNNDIAGAPYKAAHDEHPWKGNRTSCTVHEQAFFFYLVNPSQVSSHQVSERSNISEKMRFVNNIGNMFKTYTSNNDRYDGSLYDNLDRKFTLFVERCEQNLLVDEACKREFSIMLQRPAHQKYFDKLRSRDLNFLQLSAEISKRFYTEERIRAQLKECKTVLLKDMISKNQKNMRLRILKSWFVEHRIQKHPFLQNIRMIQSFVIAY